jgi:hypothetical protein
MRDPTLRRRWRGGPASAEPDHVLVSFTEFKPQRVRDLVPIYLAARRLTRECTRIKGCVGVTTYWRPRPWSGGSLTAWESRDALRDFITLPYHVQIMRRYRNRGAIRATTWWTTTFDVSLALAAGPANIDAP